MSGGHIDTVMLEDRKFPPSKEFAAKAQIGSMQSATRSCIERAIADPEKFWADLAREELHWFEPFSKVLVWKEPFAQWFVGGKTNVSYNCLDCTSDDGSRRTRRRSFGKASRATRARSRMQSCTARFASSPTCSSSSASKGRRRFDLHADGAGAGDRHAGLRPDRRGPLGDLRRLLGRGDRRPQQRRRRPSCRSRPTAAGGAARRCR